MQEKRTALIVGATGLVGKEVVSLLLKEDAYNKLVVISRRELLLNDDKLIVLVNDFDTLSSLSLPHTVDDVFCCLGTTIKKAGSQANFRKVDEEYVVNTAELALQYEACQFILISAVGANDKARIFYNRVKGEVEEKIIQKGFQTVHIVRPSMLGGARDEFRLGEKLGTWFMRLFSFLFVGKLKRYAVVEAKDVAKSMIRFALENESGVHIHESECLHD